jgi:tetratricopeptide (TPR) repeat protein
MLPVRNKDSKLTPLQKTAAVATIVGAGAAVYFGLYQFFKPTLPTSQTITIGPSKEQIEQFQKLLTDQLATKDAQLATRNAEIDALKKKLLGEHPDALPAARHDLRHALQAVTQDAEEGDPRSKQVLNFLKDGKITEALPLLTAGADEAAEQANQATQKSEKAREKAVIRYHNLGVIASLAAPKVALEAYEKALDRDRDDLVSLVGSGGLLQISYGNLDKAQARLERALTLAKTDDQAHYKFCAQACLGDIKKQRAKFSHALKYYQDGLATAADQLRKSGSGNAEWKVYLGISNESIGDLQMIKEDFPAARKSYQARYDLISPLAHSDPGNKGWQRDLSISHQKIGDVQKEQGDPEGAMESYRKSRDIIEPLAKSAPGNLGWQRDLAVSYQKVGGMLKEKGDLEAALKSFRDSHVIFEQLTKSDQDNWGWQRDLSVSYDEIGGVLEAKGNPEAALKSYQDRLPIAKRLAQSDPGNARWQLDVAVSLSKLAHVHQQSGDKKKARDYLRQAKAIRARLTKLSPGITQWKQELDQLDRDMAGFATDALRGTLSSQRGQAR